jgi:hypothetical protein
MEQELIQRPTPTDAGRDGASPTTRSLVLVAGSGRSGTSLFTGILQRLGFHVPKPEVPRDDTNPRGFGESKWVVDLHTGLLERARVQVADARPAAWALTADVGLEDETQRRLTAWLEDQLRRNGHIVVKDPRLCWFLPLWRRCAEELGVPPRFVTVLRHPAAVIDSKQRWYGPWQGDVERTAGWLNQSLFTERATRGAPRAFVRYDDLVEDWTRAVAQLGDALDLHVIRDASPAAMRSAHGFVDRGLSRSRADWDKFEIPQALREHAEEVWQVLSLLAQDDDTPGREAVEGQLEAARTAYIRMYEEAEAIARSSIVAARRPHAKKARLASRTTRLMRKVPKRWRRKIPLRWRVVVARAIQRREVARR